MWKYIKKHIRSSYICPCCGGDQVDGHAVVICVGHATQEVTCLACGAAWTDEYKLCRIFGEYQPDKKHRIPEEGC